MKDSICLNVNTSKVVKNQKSRTLVGSGKAEYPKIRRQYYYFLITIKVYQLIALI
jgi:hypothetical protein